MLLEGVDAPIVKRWNRFRVAEESNTGTSTLSP